MNDVFKGDRNDPPYFLGLWNEILLRVLQIMAAYIIATINNSTRLIFIDCRIAFILFLTDTSAGEGRTLKFFDLPDLSGEANHICVIADDLH